MIGPLLVLTLVAPPVTASAQAPGIHMIKADHTPIRCGSSSEHYPFRHADAGQLVHVIEWTPEWARVQTEGPVFDDAWVWIRCPEGAAPMVEVQPDGHTGVTRRMVELIAPNATSSAWSDSFGWAGTLPEGTSVTVLDASTASPDVTGGAACEVFTIAMPTTATGWIAADALVAASDAEKAAWQRGWREAPSWAYAQPTSPLHDWTAWADTRAVWIAAQQQPAEPEVVEVAAEVIVEPEPQPEPVVEVYHNEQFDALENTLAATPLHKLTSMQAANLRAGYVAVIDQEAVSHPRIAEQAEFRLRQLDLAASINNTRRDIEAARARIERSSRDLDAQAKVLDESPEYVIRGTLAVSSVFNGVKRPLYYRLQDPFSGRSLAYVSPESAVDIRGMLGQRVGIVGTMQWNPDIQVMTVTPQRVDLVSVVPPQ
ncbi:MAG: hypothetical protein QF733_05600 [Phycisphaerales bacterium]|jgi:hypothetical protein|nr:hypothetical protein [Phycisphaerales bacterium]